MLQLRQSANYIEGTGTQYINTGFTPDNNTRIRIDLQKTVMDAKGVFGVRGTSTTDKNYSLTTISSGTWATGYGSSYKYNDIGNYDTNRHIFDKNKQDLYLDGVLKTSLNANTFTCSGSMYLFAGKEKRAKEIEYRLLKTGEGEIMDEVKL